MRPVSSREGFCRVNIFGRYWVYIFRKKVAMSHTGSRKKTWMILLVICICQNSSQSSWLLGLNSGNLVPGRCKDHQFQELGTKTLLPFSTWKNKLCYCTKHTWLVLRPLVLPHNPSDWCLFHRLFQAKILRVFLLHNGNKISQHSPLHTLSHLKESLWQYEASFRKLLSTASTNGGLCGGTSRSLVFLWVCKRAFTKYCCFSLSLGIVKLYPSITSRKTGSLEVLFVPGEHSLKENPLVDME